MRRRTHLTTLFLIFLTLIILTGIPALAQTEPQPAEIANDEGGVQIVTGTIPNSDPTSREFYDTPIVILEDQAGFIDRDFDYYFPPESQVLGDFTEDFYNLEDLEINYQLLLPIAPQGGQRDVDNDTEDEAGVQVFAVAMWNNIYGDLTLERYDFYGYGGWSGADATTLTSEHPESAGEYTGGRIVVWSPDDAQGFPSGFGEDEMLFTEDDPIVILPAGWTMVDMDTDPFTFDRSASVTMNTYESEAQIPDDFSDLSYTEAFAEILEIGRNEYAYTEYKGVDWDALEAEFMPRFQEAEDNQDAEAYLFAMYDFARSIPDGHVGFGTLSSTVLEDAEQALIDGGLGISLRELTDGRILVNFLLEDSPADEAGIEFGAEIVAINGLPIEEAIAAVDSVNAPYSLPSLERLDQLRFVTRFPLDTEVEVTYRNPGDTEDTTVTLTAVAERDSLGFSRQFVYGQAVFNPLQPVAWEILPSGYGYIAVNTFAGQGEVVIEPMLDFIATAKALGVPGIIIDLRNNSGGYTGYYWRLASLFHSEEIVYGYSEAYNRDIDAFYYDPEFPNVLLPYPDAEARWDGPVALLVNPACASSCEGFAQLMTLNDRSAVVGQYSTNGIIGGRYFDIALPEDSFLSLPTIRDIDLEGNVTIEGIGIPPTVLVPVTEENMAIGLDEQDVVLDAAIAYLDEATSIPVTDGGTIEIGQTVEGTLVLGERIRYTLNVPEDVILDFIVDDGQGGTVLDSVLRLYVDPEGAPVLENDDAVPGERYTSELLEVEVPGGLVVIVEVGGYDDAVEGDFTLTIRESGAGEAESTEAAEPTEEATTEATMEATEEATPEATPASGG